MFFMNGITHEQTDTAVKVCFVWWTVQLFFSSTSLEQFTTIPKRQDCRLTAFVSKGTDSQWRRQKEKCLESTWRQVWKRVNFFSCSDTKYNATLLLRLCPRARIHSEGVKRRNVWKVRDVNCGNEFTCLPLQILNTTRLVHNALFNPFRSIYIAHARERGGGGEEENRI